MYYRNIKQYQYLTNKPETGKGEYVLMVAIVMAIVIYMYFGIYGTAEHLDMARGCVD